MITFIGIIGIAANSLTLAFGLSAFVMGIVFFLIGLPQMKKKSASTFLNKDVAYIMATMAILLTLLVLMGISIYLSKELLFSSVLSPVETLRLGKRLLFVIGVVVLWGFVCSKWLLPIVFDPIKLSKKQMTVIMTGMVSMIVVGVDAVMQN